jgi:glycosyltransferase involved in cell wall biosynthesis
MHRKTVVLVCMVDSIHVARWIAQFDPTEVRFILFPSGPNRRVHPKIVEMIKRGKQFDNQMTMVPFGGRLSLPLWAIDRFFSDRIRGLILRRILKEAQPDFVHALEFQHAGYVTIRALEDERIKTPFIATNYGSDIYWFQRFPRHRARIRKILVRANRYSAECRRDYELAGKFGFLGAYLPCLPNSPMALALDGGYVSDFQPEPRSIVMIKGYHGWAGRGLDCLNALRLARRALVDYQIVVYSADLIVRIVGSILKILYAMQIKTYRKGALNSEEMSLLFSKSYLVLASSRTDGLSTSAIEAYTFGCIPLQSSTACISEWVPELFPGQYFAYEDKRSIAHSLEKALHDRTRLTLEVERARESVVSRLQQIASRREHRLFYQ